MAKSTAVLHDSNLSGGVVIPTEDTAEEFAQYVASRSGLWTHFDTEDGGAIILSSEWSVDFFEGVEFDQAAFDSGEGIPASPSHYIEGTEGGEEYSINDY